MQRFCCRLSGLVLAARLVKKQQKCNQAWLNLLMMSTF
jgi:hypothetical protein